MKMLVASLVMLFCGVAESGVVNVAHVSSTQNALLWAHTYTVSYVGFPPKRKEIHVYGNNMIDSQSQVTNYIYFAPLSNGTLYTTGTPYTWHVRTSTTDPATYESNQPVLASGTYTATN